MEDSAQQSANPPGEAEQQQLYQYLKEKYEVKVDKLGNVSVAEKKPEPEERPKPTVAQLMGTNVKLQTDVSQLKLFNTTRQQFENSIFDPYLYRKSDLTIQDPNLSDYQEQQELQQEQEEKAEQEQAERDQVEKEYMEKYGLSPFKLQEENNSLAQMLSKYQNEKEKNALTIQNLKVQIQKKRLEIENTAKLNDQMNEQINQTKVIIGQLIAEDEK